MTRLGRVAAALVLALAAVAHADRIELADGTTIEGDVVRQDSEFVWLRVDGRIQRFDLSQVVGLERDEPRPADDAERPKSKRTEARRTESERGRDDGGQTPPETPPAPEPTTEAPPKDAPPKDAPPEDAPPEDAPPEDAPPEDAPPTDASPTGADDDPPAPALDEREAQARRDAVTERVIHLFELGKTRARVAAMDELVRGWPWSADALDAALSHDDARIRADAVRVLADEAVGDQTPRLLRALDDSSGTVRLLAAREIRDVKAYARGAGHDRHADVESRLMRLLDEEPEWRVRQDALRTLEVVGTERCLQQIVEGFATAHDDRRRARHHRALVAILGRDLGDDPAAWEQAVATKLRDQR